MRISDNMSRSSFLSQVRILRTIVALFLIFAFAYPQHCIDLAAFSGVSLIVSMVFSRRRTNFMLEVYDFGDRLKLKLDSDEVLIALSEIEKLEIRDGKDGLDWVIIHLCFESKFGRLIQFYPNMVKIPAGRLDVWLANINERISASRIIRECSIRPSNASTG